MNTRTISKTQDTYEGVINTKKSLWMTIYLIAEATIFNGMQDPLAINRQDHNLNWIWRRSTSLNSIPSGGKANQRRNHRRHTQLLKMLLS
ncbi:MAG TPA: hypothetical protein DER01_09540, partial [Phycisphaerales bacterium]|nr:hypothetical protein [Phycisphaerales bacterium]